MRVPRLFKKHLIKGHSEVPMSALLVACEQSGHRAKSQGFFWCPSERLRCRPSSCGPVEDSHLTVRTAEAQRS